LRAVNAVVDVVLSNLNQVDDRVTVVGVSASENDALTVEFLTVRLNELAVASAVVALLSMVILFHCSVVLGGLQGLFSL